MRFRPRPCGNSGLAASFEESVVPQTNLNTPPRHQSKELWRKGCRAEGGRGVGTPANALLSRLAFFWYFSLSPVRRGPRLQPRQINRAKPTSDQAPQPQRRLT